MYILLIWTLFCFEQFQCSRPRSVNLALETVLEFDKDADIELVEKVQNFLSKVKSTIEESRRNGLNARRSNSLLFSDHLGELIDVLKSYSDVDLTTFLKLVKTELNNLEDENCTDETIEFDISKFINEVITNFEDQPASDMRRNLDDVLRKFKEEELKEDSALHSFVNSLINKRSKDKFGSILNNLQLFRRRQFDTSFNLRSLVRDSVGIILRDYYCSLGIREREEIRELLKEMFKKSKKEKRIKKKIYATIDRTHKKGYRNIKRKKDSTQGELDRQKKYKALETAKKLKDGRNPFEISILKFDNVEKSKEKASNEINDIRKSKRPTKSRETFKRKTKTTTQSTVDDNFENEYKSIETTEANKKRKRFKIEDRKRDTKKEKRKRKNKHVSFKSARYTNGTESEIKNKQFLMKLMSKDDSDYNSKDDLPIWVKYAGKKSTNTLKTFITLYPEQIDIYKASTTKHRRGTGAVRKRFKIKSSRDDEEDNYNVITTHAEIDIDIDKSLLKPETIHHGYTGMKRQDRKRNRLSGKHTKIKNKIHMKAKSDIDFIPADFTSKDLETSSIQALSLKDSSSGEHFGSLYKLNKYNREYNNNNIKSYRKSNVKDEVKSTTPDNKLNITTNSTDKINTISTSKDDYEDGHSAETTTETFGTLAFWSGTEKSTNTTTHDVTQNLLMENQTTTVLELSKNSSEPHNIATTKPIFRSQDESNDTKSNLENDIKSVENGIKIKNVTDNTTNSPNKTSEKHPVVTIKNVTGITTKLNLRRYVDNMEINEVEDDEKKGKIKEKIKEDLAKLFTTKVTTTPILDPIDELEDAFKL